MWPHNTWRKASSWHILTFSKLANHPVSGQLAPLTLTGLRHWCQQGLWDLQMSDPDVPMLWPPPAVKEKKQQNLKNLGAARACWWSDQKWSFKNWICHLIFSFARWHPQSANPCLLTHLYLLLELFEKWVSQCHHRWCLGFANWPIAVVNTRTTTWSTKITKVSPQSSLHFLRSFLLDSLLEWIATLFRIHPGLFGWHQTGMMFTRGLLIWVQLGPESFCLSRMTWWMRRHHPESSKIIQMGNPSQMSKSIPTLPSWWIAVRTIRFSPAAQFPGPHLSSKCPWTFYLSSIWPRGAENLWISEMIYSENGQCVMDDSSWWWVTYVYG